MSIACFPGSVHVGVTFKIHYKNKPDLKNNSPVLAVIHRNHRQG